MTLVIRIPAVGIFIWNTGAWNIRHIPHFKYSGSDGGGEFYAGTGSLGSLHAGRASGCRGSNCAVRHGRLCDRRTQTKMGIHAVLAGILTMCGFTPST